MSLKAEVPWFEPSRGKPDTAKVGNGKGQGTPRVVKRMVPKSAVRLKITIVAAGILDSTRSPELSPALQPIK